MSSILVVGLSHRSAPVTLLERAAVSGDRLDKLLHDVQQVTNVDGAVVVSTCNRIEVYADVEKFHAGVSSISELLSRHSDVPLEELSKHLYVHYEERAVQHIFSVACGLDSMVVGEGQILGQLRTALKVAQANDTVDRALNELVQQALRVGKRARNETGIDRAGASLVSVGLSRAGSLEGRRALVVGAGSMSGLAVATLARGGIGEIVIANRTYERGAHLARSADVPARAIELSDLRQAMAEADIVVSCTGATGLVITPDMIDGPAFLLDLALPHDVDPAVRDLPGVTLVALSDLRDADDAPAAGDIEAVRRIVCEEVQAFQLGLIAATVAPTVVALRSKAAEVVDAELGRLGGRLPGLDDKAREEIAQTVRRVVDKLLHAPTVRVKELAASPGGDTYTEALRELFDLDPKTPEAVIRAEDVL
ncbi:glutamyl-tRNA reductase [Actinoallomurus iriomotensis]|uniref:Glutamyl-tRNA reductase n=1 Tax=Actinoallomurus iriomotensis TaxID=478107 RepID=A0A9W6RTH5_9ACTN|nr:glutamyl-tRNA reductase [Actinoallomurus iriomotensis]GLY79887.1 glutamyl-tRNA reductase [Actinoallomurus iriomotensis]